MTVLVTEPSHLAEIAARAAAAPRLAVDAEGNGMHAYRSRLCTLQLAWHEGGALHTAIVDTLAVDPMGLAPVLGPQGPLKVLHDLTFDARMLTERGITLGNVHDTSVAARFLDETNTGLSALSERELGVSLTKDLQHHDWSRRPLEEHHLGYLAGDVLHLLDLADALHHRVEALGIVAEVALENAYKLATSLAPSSSPPDYTKAKGYRDLPALEQAILRRLFGVRDALAEADDVPPHKISPAPVLLEIARRRPRRTAELSRLCRGRAARHLERWLEAVRQGIEDGAPPAHEQPEIPIAPSREERARRKDLERALTRWRKSEAAARGVSAQVVIPGHCLGPLVSALIGDPGRRPEALAAIPGLGGFRIERYGASWLALAAAPT